MLFPELPVAGEPDRHHRAVRALARSHPRLCRHRLARPRRLLRHRRLHRRPVLQIRLGRAVHRPHRRRRARPALVGYATSFIIARFRHLTLIMITLGLGLLLKEAANSAQLADRRRRRPAGHRRSGRCSASSSSISTARPPTPIRSPCCSWCSSCARRLIHSPFGLALRGIRENWVRMPAIGAPAARISARSTRSPPRIAGIAGALLAQTTETVSLEALELPALGRRAGDAGARRRRDGSTAGWSARSIFMVARDQFSGIAPQYLVFLDRPAADRRGDVPAERHPRRPRGARWRAGGSRERAARRSRRAAWPRASARWSSRATSNSACRPARATR